MTILLDYEYRGIIPFGDGEYYTLYKLTLLKRSLFGLIKKEVTLDYEVNMFQSIYQHEKHWDQMIAEKLPVKPTEPSSAARR
jgi:hypothetical protein